MRYSIIGATALAAQALADAPETMDNPVGVVYEAVLPDKPFFSAAAIEGNAKGSITAVARENGKGVRFTVMFENLPAEGGPFTYHIHKAPAIDGNCTSTLSHLDPFGAGVEVPCNPDQPQTCEVGDLAGKHGKVESDPYEKHYVDLYASTNPDDKAFFGNLSFVLHYANSTRLTCANFERKMMPMPTPGDVDCTDEPMTPTETMPMSATETMTDTIMPAMSESMLTTMTKSMMPGVTETLVVQVPCVKDCEPEGDMGGEDNTVMPPSTQDSGSDGIAPPASTPTPEVPVEAGASLEQLSITILSMGFAVALFMSS